MRQMSSKCSTVSGLKSSGHSEDAEGVIFGPRRAGRREKASHVLVHQPHVVITACAECCDGSCEGRDRAKALVAAQCARRRAAH